MKLKITIPFALSLSLMACDVIEDSHDQLRDIEIPQSVDSVKSVSLGRCAAEEDGLTLGHVSHDDEQNVLYFDGSSVVVQRKDRELAWLSLDSMEDNIQVIPNAQTQAIHWMDGRRTGMVEYISGEEHHLSVHNGRDRIHAKRIKMAEPMWDVKGLVVSPNGNWILPTQFFTFNRVIQMAHMKSGRTVKVETSLDGANQAMFLDNETFLVAGSVNWSGLGVEIKDVNHPDETIATWMYEDRRCGSPGQILSLEQSPNGKSILVSGELYGNGFIALLDSATLEEKAIVYDLDWSVQNALFIDENTVASVGTSVRFWDAQTMEEKRSIELDGWASDAVMMEESLLLVDSEGDLLKLECADQEALLEGRER